MFMCWARGLTKARTKNGSQQMRNVRTTIATVRVAFHSCLAYPVPDNIENECPFRCHCLLGNLFYNNTTEYTLLHFMSLKKKRLCGILACSKKM